MKKILMFTMDTCPYCKSAHKWMDEILKSDARYKAIPLTIVDENKNPEISAKYDYSYVPTYYLDGEKVHDGAASFEIVKKIFDAALN
ncbi:MAG: thioredoxin family protein [Oscillospiraceae bacterium]|nr:thioredoxin family protein [Oscillospiraceae bacterium]